MTLADENDGCQDPYIPRLGAILLIFALTQLCETAVLLAYDSDAPGSRPCCSITPLALHALV